MKLVMDEPESGALIEALTGWPERTSAEISTVEVLRAVRLSEEARLPRARQILTGLVLVRITGPVLEAAARLDPSRLRALDAIHIAAAQSVSAALDALITYDKRMSEAAVAGGLRVVSPH